MCWCHLSLTNTQYQSSENICQQNSAPKIDFYSEGLSAQALNWYRTLEFQSKRNWQIFHSIYWSIEVLKTSSMSARRLLTSLVGHTSVLPNAATCWFLAPELSSADGVFQLLHRPSGTLFRHICARHWLVADSLELGYNLISLQMPTSDPLRTYLIRV